MQLKPNGWHWMFRPRALNLAYKKHEWESVKIRLSPPFWCPSLIRSYERNATPVSRSDLLASPTPQPRSGHRALGQPYRYKYQSSSGHLSDPIHRVKGKREHLQKGKIGIRAHVGPGPDQDLTQMVLLPRPVPATRQGFKPPWGSHSKAWGPLHLRARSRDPTCTACGLCTRYTRFHIIFHQKIIKESL